MQLLMIPKICVSLGQVPRRWTIPNLDSLCNSKANNDNNKNTKNKRKEENKTKRARHLPLSHWRHIRYTSSLIQIPSHVCVPKVSKNHNSKRKEKGNPIPPLPPSEFYHGIHQNESLHVKIFSRSVLREHRARQSFSSSLLSISTPENFST